MAVVSLLMSVAGRYGFHGDEFYFIVTGHHLQLAAPDNPMLVPYLAAGWYAVVGGSLSAFRILPALAAGALVLVGGAAAHVLGLPRRGQSAAAVAVALSAITLGSGHLFETTTFDLVVTAAGVVLLVRALHADPDCWRPWIGVGVTVGIAMEIKMLAALVMACCLLGVVIMGPRRRLTRPQPWLAVIIALALAAPNLSWQLAHGMPMLQVAGNIAAGGSTSSTPRVALIPAMLLDTGPILSIVLVVGIIRLLPRPVRTGRGWLPVAFGLFVALMLLTGGKAYYPMPFMPVLLAAGADPVLTWLLRRNWRRVLGGGLAALSAVVTAALTLPLAPVGSAVFDVALAVNPDLGSEIGWPGYVATVARVADAVPAADLPDTIIVTQNYQQAAALQVLGPRGGYHLPPVFSGHNGYGDWGPPPITATDAIVIGRYTPAQLHLGYRACFLRARIAVSHDVDNDLNATPVWWCTGQRQPWSLLWPQVRHIG